MTTHPDPDVPGPTQRYACQIDDPWPAVYHSQCPGCMAALASRCEGRVILVAHGATFGEGEWLRHPIAVNRPMELTEEERVLFEARLLLQGDL